MSVIPKKFSYPNLLSSSLLTTAQINFLLLEAAKLGELLL